MIDLHERMLPTRRESNPQPSDHQSDAQQTEPSRLVKTYNIFPAPDKRWYPYNSLFCFVLFLQENRCCGHSLEVPNEYSQYVYVEK